MEGIRPTDRGQHKTVVEITGALLSSSDAKDAFTDAVSLVRKILAEAKRRNPQSE